MILTSLVSSLARRSGRARLAVAPVLLLACGARSGLEEASATPPPSDASVLVPPDIVTNPSSVHLRDIRACWRFEQIVGTVAVDDTGRFPGQVIGMQPVPGRVGGALAWRGNGQALRIPEATLEGLRAGTLALFLRRDVAGTLIRVFAKVSPGRFSEFGVEVTPDDRVLFSIRQRPPLRAAWSFPLGTFVHLALTWGPAGKSIFIDGNLVASDRDSTGVGTSASLSEFGRDPNQVLSGSRGTIDEVQIYDRALNESEVRALARSR